MSINLEKFISRKNEKIKFNQDTWINMEYNDVLYIISKTVRDYREEHNLTQEDLADMLNISQPMIGKIESSKYNATVKFLVKLWNKLSTKDENFADKLLGKIYDRVNNNYRYSIEIRYDYEDLSEEYENILNLKFKEKYTTQATYSNDCKEESLAQAS